MLMIKHEAKNVEKLGKLEFGISETGLDADFQCDVEVEVEVESLPLCR